MKNVRKVITRNYRDPKSPFRWLVRSEDEAASQASAYKAVIAHDIEFGPAPKIERALGCTTVAFCTSAEPALPSAPHKGYEQIGWDGHSFYNVTTASDMVADKVRAIHTLYLNEDGEKWALFYDPRQSRSKRNFCLAVFFSSLFIWGAIITYLAFSWQDIEWWYRPLWMVPLIFFTVVQYVYFEKQHRFRKRY